MSGAFRLLIRTVKFTSFQKAAEPLVAPSPFNATKFQVRNINTDISPNVYELDKSKLPDYETSNKEWHYVERLIPLKVVPQPKYFDGPAPSGWIPPKEEGLTHPYYIPRTKNHMMQVYLKISQRGCKHVTCIRKIEGDIWKCEKDIRKFLKPQLPELTYARLSSRVNEMTRQIHFRGDYVAYVKKWMEIKGF
ncbi:large ribosomal subunit protein mL49 [Phymastichus coffea]|uniref:large ribosomal subunit protein mL49 n=1 Tax=Phymastichus coffea TaxID=108790 RepID=UPI00273B1D7A|nr:large ribosomal subunit protein mL49 [Phymastichus coffea]